MRNAAQSCLIAQQGVFLVDVTSVMCLYNYVHTHKKANPKTQFEEFCLTPLANAKSGKVIRFRLSKELLERPVWVIRWRHAPALMWNPKLIEQTFPVARKPMLRL